jgi:hypothetical protein
LAREESVVQEPYAELESCVTLLAPCMKNNSPINRWG